MNYTELSSSPGSVTQVRECTNAIMHVAKSFEIPAILVGHVNKDGAIADERCGASYHGILHQCRSGARRQVGRNGRCV